MAKPKQQPKRGKHVALLLVEGETEEEFYQAFARKFFSRTSKQINNLRGNYGINKIILDKAKQYAEDNPHDTFDVYVCIDQERIGTPPFNTKLIEEKRKAIGRWKRTVPVIAALMIESLFFIDMGGIYKYLSPPKTKRRPKKFAQFRTLTHKDLSALFKQFGKQYRKGYRCEGLVAKLDLELLHEKAEELQLLVSFVKGR